MKSVRKETPVLFHLDSEIYKNGLKFDRDRTFRNKLIVKTILLMAVLLVIATVSCVYMAKSSGSKLTQNNIILEPNEKVPIYYEPTTTGEKNFLTEIRTSFVPPLPGYQITAFDAPGELSNSNEKKIKEGDARFEKIKEISRFWKDHNDHESIRNSQAKKMLSYMDLTADPCSDFYQYACGNWEKNNPIPQDKIGYDIFELLRESLDIILSDLLTEPSDNETSEAVVKAKTFYQSCMDEDILEERGNEPLITLSKKLNGWPTIENEWNSSQFHWIDLAARIKLYGNGFLINQRIGPDIKNSSQYIIQFDQSSLGLPIKEYYLKESKANYLEAYKKFFVRVTSLLGAKEDKAIRDAEEIILFEKELAKITLGEEERRNLSELYAKMNLLELCRQVPEIDWLKYLNITLGRNLEAEETPVVIYGIKYFKALVRLVENTEKRIVCNYLMWRFMNHKVANMGRKFQDAQQEFHHALSGREKPPLRRNFCVSHVKTVMGLALSSIFVERYFDKTSKNDTVSMTRDIMRSFRQMLNTTEWIDPETKTIALNKINGMALKIGYPEFLLDKKELDQRYNELNITRDYFENSLNIYRHATRLEQQKFGTGVNKSEFFATPTTVNAYYSMNINQIMVPAGILQPPFYHKYFPKSLNYGGIGVVIGHEITHAFDDRGRYFDQNGNYHKWWKEETVINFHRRAQCLIDQYSKYTVRDVDMPIDGVKTQGENIADNGGIRQAFKAYERWLKENEYSDEVMPGINATNFQLFFLNFAQIWCGEIRPEASRNKLKTAPHSPGRYRVIGTLSNSEEFAKVFRCPSNMTMNPSRKCSLW